MGWWCLGVGGKNTPQTGGGAAFGGTDTIAIQEALAPASAVLKAAREYGASVIHTTTYQENPELGTAAAHAAAAADPVPEEDVSPLAGELVIHQQKGAKGAFWNTNLETELRGRGITSLLFTGVTTDACVQITMKEAKDRGFLCLVVEEATASFSSRFKEFALEMISGPGGIGCRRCKLAEVLEALDPTRSAHLGNSFV
jgi:nicotinamidase-related amidase